MVMSGLAFSKLAMTCCGLVVQVHHVSVTFAGDACATAAVPATTPSSVAVAAPNENNFLSIICYPLVEIPDFSGPDPVGPMSRGDEPPGAAVRLLGALPIPRLGNVA